MATVKGPYDAVFLDFYGTVSAGDRDAVLAACRKVLSVFQLPLTADELAVAWGEHFFTVVDRSNHTEFQTLYQCELQSLRETIGGWVGPFDPAPFVEELEAYWRNPPLHEDVLSGLSNVRVPICCVSNADAEPLHTAIGRHGLRFDAVVCSEHSRCYKPDPVIFQRAVEALRVDPKRAIHVGDSLHSDVSGASKLGIATAWINRGGRIHDIGTCAANFHLSTLDDLAELLG